MSENDEIAERTFCFEIDEVALFEDRRYKKSFCKRFLFVRQSFIENTFGLSVDFAKVTSTVEPTCNANGGFIHLTDLKGIISNSTYGQILHIVLKSSNKFEMVNIIFYYLVNFQEIEKPELANIITYSLTSKLVRNSFEAQKYMLQLVSNSKKKIEPTLFHQILSEFPHASRGGWVKTSKL